MHRLARWHIWLGWLVGVPLLLWTASGLFMVARPIEEVRGNHLRRDPPLVEARGIVFPALQGPVTHVALLSVAGRPVWAIAQGNTVRRYDAHSGTRLGPVGRAEAQAIVVATYRGSAALSGLRLFPADRSPADLGRDRPAWQARFAEGTHVYVDADTGEVLALRTRWWRAFDFMWGLHIMDLKGREDTHHPILVASAALSLAGCLIGCILMFRRRKARRRPGK